MIHDIGCQRLLLTINADQSTLTIACLPLKYLPVETGTPPYQQISQYTGFHKSRVYITMSKSTHQDRHFFFFYFYYYYFFLLIEPNYIYIMYILCIHICPNFGSISDVLLFKKSARPRGTDQLPLAALVRSSWP